MPLPAPLTRAVQLSALAITLGWSGAAEARAAFSYISNLQAPAAAKAIVVDTRPLASCLKRTVAGAHCLPSEALLGPHGALPPFRQLVWVLGTAGLAGRGSVVVAGDSPEHRDFVAGLLFLLGQKRVLVLTPALDQVLKVRGITTGPGTGPAMVARPLFQGWARSDLIVFPAELLRSLSGDTPPALLDGRSDSAYWGVKVTALRGGHIPGAQSLPAARIQGDRQMGRTGPDVPAAAIAYAGDAVSSIAYFTLLKAGLGADVRVFPWGWQEWADHTNLPVDAETLPPHPHLQTRSANTRGSTEIEAMSIAVAIASLLLSLTALWIAVARRH